ncbi:hypothetical protein [Acetobacter sp.]|uniref:hypothetical protein n=1 Tax=Acetobacter sp. TaxID=440 RepID=UPI0039EBD731
MTKPDFFQSGDFLQAHPCEPAFQNMVALPFREDQVSVRAALLLVNHKGEVFRVCMEFFTQAIGEVRKLIIRHGLVRIEGEMTQAIGQPLPSGFAYSITHEPVRPRQSPDGFILRTMQHMAGQSTRATARFNSAFLDDHGA